MSSDYFMDLGATQTIEVTVSPEDAHDKTLTWTSSNEEIATVDENGVVTAVKAGKVTITAKAHNEIQEEFEIIVLETTIDSEKDEFYDGVIKISGSRSNPVVTHDVYVKLGESGIYVYQVITDGSTAALNGTGIPHVELYLTFGLEKVADKSLSVHLYNDTNEDIRCYTYNSTLATTKDNGEIADEYCDYSSKFISNDGNVVTYQYELFVNYRVYFNLFYHLRK